MLNLYSAVALVGTIFAIKAAQSSITLAFGTSGDKKLLRLKEKMNQMVKDAYVAVGINVPLFVSFGVIKSAWKFWGFFMS